MVGARVFLVLILLAAGQWWWSRQPPLSEVGLFIPTHPSGARVFCQKSSAYISRTGRGSGATQQIEVGVTPGPLQLTQQDFPCTLTFCLPLYRSVRPFAAAPNLTAPFELEPTVPILAPAVYFFKEFPFVAVAGVFLIAVGRRRRLAHFRLSLAVTREERVAAGEVEAGDCIGGYRLERLLGRGGMAQVFAARPEAGGDTVALKLLHRSHDAQARRRWMQEAGLCKTLQHPYLVFLYDWGEFGANLYLALEYVEGRTLADTARSHPGISSAQVLQWGVEVASALVEVHRLGIVHRDIKPANVMIRPDGRAKLMDFGISRRAEDAGPSEIVGTPGFMAPEQLGNLMEPVDWRGDFYALAATLYFAASAREPFAAPSTLGVLQRQILMQFESLDRPWWEDLSPWLQPDPAQRRLTTPEEALELLRRLRARC